MRHRLVCLGVVWAALVLSACGGGGGSGGGSGAASGGGASTALTYTGLETQAAIGDRTAARFFDVLFGDAQLGGELGVAEANPAIQSAPTKQVGRAVRPAGLLRGLHALSVGARKLAVPHVAAAGLRASATDVDETTDCAVSGSARTRGTLQDNGTGTLTLTFTNCRDDAGGATLSGTADLVMRARDPAFGVLTDSTLRFTQITLVSGARSATLRGQIDSRVNVAARSDATTFNLTLRTQGETIVTDLRDFRIDAVYDNLIAPSSVAERFSGRVYLSDLGYVAIRTASTVTSISIAQAFPDGGGPIHLDGAGGSSALLEVRSARLVRIAVDANGDDVLDADAQVAWTDLGLPIAAALRDTDGDGMHDSWEQAYGLNPNSAADATSDADSDGFDNVSEYRVATLPNVSTSLPRGRAELSVGLPAPLSPTLDVGDYVQFYFLVRNDGTSAAHNVRLHLSVDVSSAPLLPASDVFAPGWTCTGLANAYTCTRPTLEAGASSRIDWTPGTPGQPGTFTYAAYVGSDDVDTQAADDAIGEVLPVRALRQQQRAVDLPIPAWAYDATRGMFVAIVPQPFGSTAPNVAFFDPATGALASEIGYVPNANVLAVSDDGSTLYVGDPMAQTITQFDLASRSVVRAFTFTDAAPTGSLRSIHVQPGRPDVLVVGLHISGGTNVERVAVYERGVRRPSMADLDEWFHALAFDPAGTRIFALLTNEFTRGPLRELRVDGDGVALARTVRDGVLGGATLAFFDGQVLTAQGDLIDVATGERVFSTGEYGPAVFDPVARRFIQRVEGTGRYRVYALDAHALLFEPRADERGSRMLMLWGTDGLAILGGAGVELVNSPIRTP